MSDLVLLRSLDVSSKALGYPERSLNKQVTRSDLGFRKVALGSSVTDGARRQGKRRRAARTMPVVEGGGLYRGDHKGEEVFASGRKVPQPLRLVLEGKRVGRSSVLD